MRKNTMSRKCGTTEDLKSNVDLLVDRFRHLPPANKEPAHPLASYYCDECGEPDWTDTHHGGGIREFYADDEMGDIICEPCMRKREANAVLTGSEQPEEG